MELVVRLRRSVVDEIFPEIKGNKLKHYNIPIGVFKCGAKLYKMTRPGDYRVSGYDSRGDDVVDAVKEIMAAK